MGEDAVRAAASGAAAVILSNHGGRNCDTSRSGIEVLPEVISVLKEEKLRHKIEVWVDGGVRRGSDVYKAIAMGADAVGLGKPAVYAMSAYGAEGISHMLNILKDELEKTMRLCGTPTLKDLNPRMVNSVSLDRHNDSIPIPSSPYVFKPPATNVRSPEFPTAGDAEGIKAAIQKLQSQLVSLEKPAPPSVDSVDSVHSAWYWSRAMLQLLRVMAVSTAQSVFATSQAGSLHRSALFLLVFLVVHMAGNLTFVFGPEAFNGYGHKLSSNPAIMLIEAYLAIGFAVHIAVAVLFTWRKKKIVARSPIESGKLALSGTVLALFLFLHLRAFRFGADRKFVSSDGSEMRDLYSIQVELFSDGRQVAFYMVSLLAVGFHLWFGWHKAVLKMAVDKELKAPFNTIGKVMIVPLCAGFALGPLWAWSIHLADIAATRTEL